MNIIPFNKPYLSGKETHYIYEAVNFGKISGNGMFTKKCQDFFEQVYGFKKVLLTTSCTDALEMTAILANLKPGDEVIIPSYTFVSTAIAFIRQGVTVVFADSCHNNPNIDADKIESLVTPNTKAIVPVHYAGMACDMDKIMEIAKKYGLLVIEDAAQAINGYYTGKDGIKRPLGSIGHFGAFSFHETKNISSGEGGMLTINNDSYIKRAEIIWEKGTNRAEFFRGEIDKYGWVDTGSSFLPSDLIAAFLWAQIENISDIQRQRLLHWQYYYDNLKDWAAANQIQIMNIPDGAVNNGHMFYLRCKSLEQRTKLIEFLKRHQIYAVFHYISLHSSTFYASKHDGRILANSDDFTNCLVRLPLFYELDAARVVKTLKGANLLELN